MIAWIIWIIIGLGVGMSSPWVIAGAVVTGKTLGHRGNQMGILGMWAPRGCPCDRHTRATIGRELALPDNTPVYELYDHPAPPIPLLGASLPTAPLGYGWEITTTINDAENPALRLAMLNLATSTVVDAIEADLTIARRWKYANDETYASFYRRAEKVSGRKVVRMKITDHYEFHGGRPVPGRPVPEYNTDHTEILGKVMMGNLITPMVDWARIITLRYIVNHPDESKCHYMLLENLEGVPA